MGEWLKRMKGAHFLVVLPEGPSRFLSTWHKLELSTKKKLSWTGS